MQWIGKAEWWVECELRIIDNVDQSSSSSSC